MTTYREREREQERDREAAKWGVWVAAGGWGDGETHASCKKLWQQCRLNVAHCFQAAASDTTDWNWKTVSSPISTPHPYGQKDPSTPPPLRDGQTFLNFIFVFLVKHICVFSLLIAYF